MMSHSGHKTFPLQRFRGYATRFKKNPLSVNRNSWTSLWGTFKSIFILDITTEIWNLIWNYSYVSGITGIGCWPYPQWREWSKVVSSSWQNDHCCAATAFTEAEVRTKWANVRSVPFASFTFRFIFLILACVFLRNVSRKCLLYLVHYRIVDYCPKNAVRGRIGG